MANTALTTILSISHAKEGVEVRLLIDNTTIDMYLCNCVCSDPNVEFTFPQMLEWARQHFTAPLPHNGNNSALHA